GGTTGTAAARRGTAGGAARRLVGARRAALVGPGPALGHTLSTTGRGLGQLSLGEAGAAAGADQHHGEHNRRHLHRAHPLPPHTVEFLRPPPGVTEGTPGLLDQAFGAPLTDSSQAADILLKG